jgi:hypothetical protein
MIVSSFIIQANVITIINYNRKTLIVQATGQNVIILFCPVITDFHSKL